MDREPLKFSNQNLAACLRILRNRNDLHRGITLNRRTWRQWTVFNFISTQVSQIGFFKQHVNFTNPGNLLILFSVDDQKGRRNPWEKTGMFSHGKRTAISHEWVVDMTALLNRLSEDRQGAPVPSFWVYIALIEAVSSEESPLSRVTTQMQQKQQLGNRLWADETDALCRPQPPTSFQWITSHNSPVRTCLTQLQTAMRDGPHDLPTNTYVIF